LVIDIGERRGESWRARQGYLNEAFKLGPSE
jgi:hypothetical protein